MAAAASTPSGGAVDVDTSTVVGNTVHITSAPAGDNGGGGIYSGGGGFARAGATIDGNSFTLDSGTAATTAAAACTRGAAA